MSFLPDASYKGFLEAGIQSIEDSVAREHVRKRFALWYQQYRVHRLLERAIEFLAAEAQGPNMLYLRDEVDLELLRLLAGHHHFDGRVFRGFLVAESLWDGLRPEWFSPFPVSRVADWQDREHTVVYTLSENQPLRDNQWDRGNDYLERFIDLGRFQNAVQMREGLQGQAVVVLYADYKKVQTLSAIAEQISRHPSAQCKTIAMLNDPNAQISGYDSIVYEPFFYLWPLVFHVLHPDIFHINVGWGTQGMPFVPFVGDRDRTVIDFYDVLSLVSDEALVKGGHGEPWELTRSSERFLFGHFDNIVHRCSESINPQLKQQYQRASDTLSVFEYLRDPVCSSPVRESDTIRLVYGGDLVNTDSPNAPLYPWTVGMMKCFSGGKLHLSLYPKPSITGFQRSTVIDHLAEMLELSNIHSCVPLPEDEFIAAISEYDYGVIGPTPEAIRPLEYGYGPPFKIIAYLRAGLPIVVPEDFTMIADIVRKYNIGVVYTYNDLDRIPELLGNQDIRQLKANVISCREHLRIEKGAAKVLRLYAGMLSCAPSAQRVAT
jgi:hypothetical protein